MSKSPAMKIRGETVKIRPIEYVVGAILMIKMRDGETKGRGRRGGWGEGRLVDFLFYVFWGILFWR